MNTGEKLHVVNQQDKNDKYINRHFVMSFKVLLTRRLFTKVWTFISHQRKSTLDSRANPTRIEQHYGRVQYIRQHKGVFLGGRNDELQIIRLFENNR